MHLWKHERGAADPVLMVGSIAVGLILVAFSAGIITMVVKYMGSYSQTSVVQASLNQAQQAIANDGASSAHVAVADGASGQSQAVTFFSPLAGNKQGYACRVSTWQAKTVALGEKRGVLGESKVRGQGIVLTDTVRMSKDASCSTIPSGAGATPITVEGWAGLPTWTLENSVGSAVKWSGGKVAAVTADAKTKSQGYATSTEMSDPNVATVILTGTIDLPLGGKSTETLTGHGVRDDAMPANPATSETPPGRTLFQPSAQPTVKTANSGFPKIAGEIQGITVAGADNAPQCGALPYASDSVVVAADVPSGNATTYSKTMVYSSTGIGGNLPLGAGGRVKVSLTQECVAVADGGNQKPGTPLTKTVTFTQPLPAPTVTLTEISPSQWKASWGAVSSLPTTFTISEKIAGGTFASATTTGTSITFDTPAPAYGTQIGVSVSAAAGVLTSTGNVSSGTVGWPGTSWVAYLHGTGSTGEAPQSHTVSATGAGCPAGTSQQQRALDTGLGLDSGFTSGTASYWVSGESFSETLRAIGQVRCATPYSTSPTVQTSAAWTVKAAPPAAPRASECNVIKFSGGAAAGVYITQLNYSCSRAGVDEWQAQVQAVDGQGEKHDFDVVTGGNGQQMALMGCTIFPGLASLDVFVRTHSSGGWSGWTDIPIRFADHVPGPQCA
ncbi:hypothetical protein GCM10022288_15880 [Gryllotalpicola kribbensis]|uniref:Flp pilus-assembly TadG-like N-terminal domain-containing protein n=1 Tax=Gryllotalpicola kribbensis TaxID=993084 RepID=A0ABP8ASG4_9MICO